MEAKVYGYARVSTADQNETRQLAALAEAGVAVRRLYVDKVSGKDFDRPEYNKLVRRLKAGDLLLIQSIDRLGRNYEEIQNQWRLLTKEKNRITEIRYSVMNSESVGYILKPTEKGNVCMLFNWLVRCAFACIQSCNTTAQVIHIVLRIERVNECRAISFLSRNI